MLRSAGLRSDITSDIFMQCAREVAAWRDQLQGGNERRKDYVWDTALELGRHYAQDAAALHPASIYSSLRGLPCFPAVKVCLALSIPSSE